MSHRRSYIYKEQIWSEKRTRASWIDVTELEIFFVSRRNSTSVSKNIHKLDVLGALWAPTSCKGYSSEHFPQNLNFLKIWIFSTNMNFAENLKFFPLTQSLNYSWKYKISSKISNVKVSWSVSEILSVSLEKCACPYLTMLIRLFLEEQSRGNRIFYDGKSRALD